MKITLPLLLFLITEIETEAQTIQNRILNNNSFYSYITPDSLNIRKVGWWPYGTCYAVGYDSINNIVAIGSGEVMQLLDISNLAAPMKIGEIFLDGQNQRMKISDHKAFITTYRKSGLEIIDISEPNSPTKIGFYETPGSPIGFVVSNDIVYLPSDTELHIVNVSDPENPVKEGQFMTNGGRAAHAELNESKLYLTVWGEGFYILDVTNPSAPEQIGFYPDPDISYAAIDGNYVVLGKWSNSGIDIIDVTNSITCPKIGSVNYDIKPVTDIDISGNYAFISGEGPIITLVVLDISNPFSPSYAGSCSAGGAGGHSLALSKNFAFQSGWTEGVNIIDISNPKLPVKIGGYDTPASYDDIAISGNYACVANHSDGLRVFDISIPTSITQVGINNTIGTFYGVAASGNYAYVAAEYCGLRIFDIVTAPVPTEVGSFVTPDCINHPQSCNLSKDVVMNDHYAYINAVDSGFYIIDVSNPSAPVETSYYETPGTATKIALSPPYALVADGDAGLRIIDISNPSLPTEAGFYLTPYPATSVAASDNKAYVGAGGHIYCIDISIPSAPIAISNYYIPTSLVIKDIAISSKMAYIADLTFGLRVLDISEPGSITELGYYELPGPAEGLAVSGDYIYAAANDAGLFVLQLVNQPTNVKDITNSSNKLALSQNYPNPFNSTTFIQYNLPTAASVRLTVYDVKGKEVAILVDEFQQEGNKSIEFKANNLPSGIYLFRLTADGMTETKKFVLSR
jgi:hypothetical protein